jgi:phage terminase small subunit
MGVPVINSDTKPFKSLPKRKRAFIEHYVRSADALESFRKAGYKSTPHQERARAGKLLRDVAPYLDEALRSYVSGVEMAVIGSKVVLELAEKGENETVRLNAAKELRSRALPEVAQEQVVTHRHEGLDNQSLDDRIKALTASLQKKGALPS